MGPYSKSRFCVRGRSPPPLWSGLVSRVTSRWRKERGFTADGVPGNKGHDPDPHSPWRRARFTNASLLAKGPSPTNPRKNQPSLSRRKPPSSSPLPSLHCAATRLVSNVTEGGAARARPALPRPPRLGPCPSGRGRAERGPHPGGAARRRSELVRRPLPLRVAPRVFPA